MVYLIKDNGKQILYGLSTDDKDASLDLVTTKTDVIVYREVDTGKEYIYNTGEWYEQAGSGGGGGGGGGGGNDPLPEPSIDNNGQALVAVSRIKDGEVETTPDWGNRGYSYNANQEALVEEDSFTTEEYDVGYDFGYANLWGAPQYDWPSIIAVYYDGKRYELIRDDETESYGAWYNGDEDNPEFDFIGTPPFCIVAPWNAIVTPTIGEEHTLAVDGVYEAIALSEEFTSAIMDAIGPLPAEAFSYIYCNVPRGNGLPLTLNGATGTLASDELDAIEAAMGASKVPVIITADSYFSALVYVPLFFGGRKRTNAGVVYFSSCQTVLELDTSTGDYTIHYTAIA